VGVGGGGGRGGGGGGAGGGGGGGAGVSFGREEARGSHHEKQAEIMLARACTPRTNAQELPDMQADCYMGGVKRKRVVHVGSM